MKLAEALLLRGDTQKKLASLRERIVQYSLVQEDCKPHEDPNKLLKEAHGVIDELEKLIAAINTANLKNKTADGRTITEALAQRDSLTQWHSVITAAIGATKNEMDRYSMREIKWVAAVDVSKLQKQADDLSKQIRELNAQIQEANWRAEL